MEKSLPLVVGALGLWMAHHTMILSRLARIQGETGDSRLINYFLEHSYRWARGDPHHRTFWDPPFYYPARNVAAHSDLLVGAGFPYWASRALGAPPDTAFQLWMIAVSALNYLCGYLLFRGGLRFGRPAAAAGAFLVAFGAPRINHYVHQQLLPCFYVLLAAYALARIFSPAPPRPGPAHRLALWLLAAAATAGQLYSGFYQGWFLIWTTGLIALTALALPSLRPGFLEVVARDSWAILIASAAAWLLLRPLVSHYAQASRELHQGYYPMFPNFWSWLNTGPYHWLWGWTADFEPFRKLPTGIEDRLSIGYLTPAVCAAGLLMRRDRIACRLAMLVLLEWYLCIANFPLPGDLMAASATAIAAIGVALTFRERGEPGPRALAAIGLVAFFNLVKFPNPYVISLGLFTIGLVLVEIVRLRDAPARRMAPWLALLLGLCVPLLYWQMLIAGLAVVVPFWAFAVCGRPAFRPGQATAMAAVALVAILAAIIYSDRPMPTASLFVGIPLALAAIPRIPGRVRPSAWAPAWTTLAVLPAIAYCYHVGSPWDLISRDIPGGAAIRGVGRVMLLLLIPLGVGLASFLATLEARRKEALAWSIGLACLLEQGLTTPAYDKQAQRDRVAAIAARIEPGCEAFYYHTRRDGSWAAYVDYQIDAMWASLERGLPTIDGYTSVWPRDWIDLRLAAFRPDPDVREALYHWAKSRNLDTHRIEWINEDSGPMRFSPFFGSKPGDPEVPGESIKRDLNPFGIARP